MTVHYGYEFSRDTRVDMWLRCCRCERTLLVLERQASSPFVCPRCKEEAPNFVVPEPLVALPHEVDELTRLQRLKEFFEYKLLGLRSPHEVVIDVDPEGD